LNPANAASRGIYPDETKRIEEFLDGPKFLQEALYPNFEQPKEQATEEEMAEVKKPDVLIGTTYVSQTPLQKVCMHYSTLFRCIRATMYMLKFLMFLKKKEFDPRMSVEDAQRATMLLLRDHQERNFPQEREILQKNSPIKPSSRLISLVPFLDDKGLMRIKGRLSKSNLPEYTKTPIILDKGDKLTNLIIEDAHRSHGHVGAQHTLNLLRRKYWIIHGLSAVKQQIRRCWTCQKQRKPMMIQQMADLPPQRLTPDKPPFAYTGLDFFGPLMTKLARKEFKRYGCLFTCLASRAVHLEMAYDLSTDSFLSAFSRFKERRGRPVEVISDNGTNFIGGERELRENLKAINQTAVEQWMVQREIRWKFIAARSPHWGGVWERLVKSTKQVMYSLLKGQTLTDELLQTTLCTVEGILNDRPLTKISTDPKDEQPLTPNMLLAGRRVESLPPGVFDKKDLYSRRYWRQMNYLADVFWRRWLAEYLPILQSRSKWATERENLEKGDLVLVSEDNIPRGQWPLGIVTEPIPGEDGLVRSAKIKFQGTVKTRPITKLCRLEEDFK
jgi:hypothetical protein